MSEERKYQTAPLGSPEYSYEAGYSAAEYEIERLTAERDRLKALLIELCKYKWKSVDRDNMEFNTTITCFTMDKMRALAEGTKE